MKASWCEKIEYANDLEMLEAILTLRKDFLLVFNSEFEGARTVLLEIVKRNMLQRCKLFCGVGENAAHLEEIVDDFIVFEVRNKYWFPTVSAASISEALDLVNGWNATRFDSSVLYSGDQSEMKAWRSKVSEFCTEYPNAEKKD